MPFGLGGPGLRTFRQEMGSEGEAGKPPSGKTETTEKT